MNWVILPALEQEAARRMDEHPDHLYFHSWPQVFPAGPGRAVVQQVFAFCCGPKALMYCDGDWQSWDGRTRDWNWLLNRQAKDASWRAFRE